MIKHPQKNIYLIGFMGSGKSTVGPLLAKKMNRAFFDTDEWIINETGKTIPEIFAEDGEQFFREKEREAIQIVCKFKNMLVSVGGGAVVDSSNWLTLKKSGLMVYLQCDANEILNRVKNDLNRPLLSQAEDRLEKITSLLTQRAPIYEKADIIIDANNLTPELIAEKIYQKIKDFV
ncbi:MAG: shikimate kinase [Calditrichaeota bacterium]|nr:shikimate kinase [Calditrichota bacterium]